MFRLNYGLADQRRFLGREAVRRTLKSGVPATIRACREFLYAHAQQELTNRHHELFKLLWVKIVIRIFHLIESTCDMFSFSLICQLSGENSSYVVLFLGTTQIQIVFANCNSYR